MRDSNILPALIIKDNLIVDINSEFACATGFSKMDLIGRTCSDICNILRITPELSFDLADPREEFYLFTRNLEYRCFTLIKMNYYDYQEILFTEVPGSRYEDKFNIIKNLVTDEHIGIGIYSAPQLVLLSANQVYLNILDEPYNRKEVSIGRRLDDFVDWNKVGRGREVWTNVINTGNTYYAKEIKGITGTWKNSYSDNTLLPIIEAGKVKYIISIIDDVTEKVLLRRKNEEQQKQLEIIYENAPVGIGILDKSGRYIKINKTMKNYLGNEKFDFVGDSIEYLQYYDENGNKLSSQDLPIRSLLLGQGYTDKQCKVKMHEREAYFITSGVPVINEKNEFEIGVIIAHEITDMVKEKKQAEELKKEQEEFFSYIAHEFKTPLTTISATIQLLETFYKNEINDKVKSHISMIKRNTLQQLRLVNNLLDITRAEAGYIKLHLKNIDIVKLTRMITTSINSYANQKGIKINFESSIKEKVIFLDDEKYERILLNLLSNAIKFTPNNRQIYVSVQEAEEKTYVKVKDEGSGIPRDKQNLIFERFGQVGSSFTRQSEGTGIGLCLVKLLLKAMDGDILLESEEGLGSSFTVILPGNQKSEENFLMPEISNDRLINSMILEFSNIYLD